MLMLANKELPEHIPRVFDDYFVDIEDNGITVTLRIFDTTGMKFECGARLYSLKRLMQVI